MQKNNALEKEPRLEDFSDFVQEMMQAWKVPGVAVAIVRDGSLIYAQGFGKRDVAEDLAVTPQTLFAIASCTKAFTTASLALLVDEGKLDWNTPLREYLPDFRLHDPIATDRITPLDLVVHRTGLPRHDLAWYHSTASREELFARLRYLEPTKDLRTFWQYQNLMYMVAGHLVSRVAGQEWESFVQERLFRPLGMERSNFSIVESVKQDSNVSHPYAETNDEVKEIPFYAAQDAIAPAGAIISCVEDMSKWLLMHLNKGMYHDSQMISSSQIQWLHTPQMIVPGSSLYPEIPYSSYAPGWGVEPYKGHLMVSHSGGIDGFSSLTTLFPQEHIGLVVLTNLNGSPLPRILTYRAFERLLELDAAPWNERFREEYASWRAAGKQRDVQMQATRVADTQPSHPLIAYVGDYQHPGYGVITVSLQEEQLQLTLNGLTTPLRHYHYDLFEMELESFGIRFPVSFLTNSRGDIDTLVAPLAETSPDIVFRRVPPAALLEKQFLEQFVGVYRYIREDIIVSLHGNALLIALPGEPEYVLEPYQGMEFQVRQISGFRVEFQTEDAGAVRSILLLRSQGAFTAHRIAG